MPQLKLLFSSYLSTSALEKKALNLMQEARKKPAVVGFLVPDPGDDRRKWGDKKPINKKSLVNLTTASKINQYSASRDRQTLNKFLSVCDKSMLCYPSELNLTDIMPVGVPLLDLLAVDIKQRYDSYKYPNVDELTLHLGTCKNHSVA